MAKLLWFLNGLFWVVLAVLDALSGGSTTDVIARAAMAQVSFVSAWIAYLEEGS